MTHKKMSRSRGFVFTLNNYTQKHEADLAVIECTYIFYGRETAPTTGTPHLQGYIVFKNQRYQNAVSKLFPWWIQTARGQPDQVTNYNRKDGDFYERGDKPQSKAEIGDDEKARWDGYRKSALEGDFNAIPSDIYTRYQTSFKRMRREDVPPPLDLATQENYGIWIYGPTGTGKSHHARTHYSPLYLKDINKWWDGYEGHKNVLIDELAPEHAPYMMHFLKRWADKWTFSAEYKGGRSVIRPEKIIVTSNYSIDQVFEKASDVDLQALKRRFLEIYMPFKA